MRIAIPREVKNSEFRVAITPSGVHDLTGQGHDVVVEAGAGEGSAIPDDEYAAAGATIEADTDRVWSDAELILKVKEPVPDEFRHFRDGLVVFTYLHLAADAALTRALVDTGVIAIAYETVQLPNGSLPLLAPMSEVAGRLAPIVGANTMLAPNGGPGLLVPGVPGTHPARVTVLGGGVAGSNATRIAVGLGADVRVLDTNVARLQELDSLYAGRITTIASNSLEVERAVVDADLVIGAVLVPGARAPKLVSNELVSRMRPGSVLVDIAVDQGGCFADSRPTTHADPTFAVHGSLFYCVANMPGAVPRTSTYALTNATLSYARAIAGQGWRAALEGEPALVHGLNVCAGAVVNRAVAEAHGMEFQEPGGFIHG
ncbi:alanine dehydrogenase [Microbacterium sp. STN6]|uniref:alanine dehydrogenase n=1 Tax=Microbacterium sp. STN6 TaxID=2995588 RepID=UPI002260ED5E|nr:alanine dehydrogenase [Microbacterium sp. STN6]MCX7521196.1 alanine dehydrogenase [Microbacterium sp. STN6]